MVAKYRTLLIICGEKCLRIATQLQKIFGKLLDVNTLWNESKDVKQEKFFTANDKQYTLDRSSHRVIKHCFTR